MAKSADIRGTMWAKLCSLSWSFHQKSTASGALRGNGEGGKDPPHQKGGKVGRAHEKERLVIPKEKAKGQGNKSKRKNSAYFGLLFD